MRYKLEKILFSIVATFFVATSFSQKETLTFKISKPKSEINLRTADSVFHTKKINPVLVEITGKSKVYRITALNGTVRRKPGNYFEITFQNEGETVIKVFEKTPNGTTRVGLTQAFKIVGPPKPKVLVCGVHSDSVIDKKHLINVGELSATLEKSRINPTVVSFDIILPVQLNSDTIHVEGNKFPVWLKNKLYDIDEGQILYFININVLMPNREIVVADEIMLFIAKTDQYSVGHRDETIRKEE